MLWLYEAKPPKVIKHMKRTLATLKTLLYVSLASLLTYSTASATHFEWVYEGNNTYRSAEKVYTTSWGSDCFRRIHIPKRLAGKKVRGVLAFDAEGHFWPNGNRTYLQSESWQGLAEDKSFGMMETATRPLDEAQTIDVFQKMLEDMDELFQRTECQYANITLSGLSGTGIDVMWLAGYKPWIDRMIAGIPNSASSWYLNPQWNDPDSISPLDLGYPDPSIPLLHMPAGREKFDGYFVSQNYPYVTEETRKGHPTTLAARLGAGHAQQRDDVNSSNYVNSMLAHSNLFAIEWLSAIIDMRLPAGDPPADKPFTLKPVDVTNGWLASFTVDFADTPGDQIDRGETSDAVARYGHILEDVQIGPWDNFPGGVDAANSWLPNEKLANYFVEYNTTGSFTPLGSNSLVSVDAPQTLQPGTDVVLTVEYSTVNDVELIVNLQNAEDGNASEGYTLVSLPAGTGSTEVTVSVNADAPVGDNYLFQTYIRPVGGVWDERFDNIQTNGISVGELAAFFVKNKRTGLFLRAYVLGTDTSLVVADNDYSDGFKWQKVSTDNGHYLLRNVLTQQYFQPSSDTDGTFMEFTTANTPLAQWSERLSNDGSTSFLVNRELGKHIRPVTNRQNSLVELRPNTWTGDWPRWTFKSTNTKIVVRALGKSTEEILKLQVGGQTVQEWTMTSTDIATYTASFAATGGDIRLAFENDQGTIRDIRVDYIEVDGVRMETEEQAVNTAGWNSATKSCGNVQTEWMHCDGYIEYGTPATTNKLEAKGLSTAQSWLSDIVVYPNPATSQLYVKGVTGPFGYHLYSMQGALVQSGEGLHEGQHINLGQASSGLYILKVTSQQGARDFRIVVE